MFKQDIKFGILSGVSLSLWFFVEYLLGFHTTQPEIGKYSGFFAATIPIFFLCLAIKKKVEEEDLETFSLFEGIKCAIIIAIISALIATAFIYIYIHYLGSQWIERALNSQREDLLSMDLEEIDIDVFSEQLWIILQESMSIFKLFIFYPLVTVLTGMIYSFRTFRKAPQ
jgi:hypothetical protein